MLLNNDEWVVGLLLPHGWFIANHTHWGKTYIDPETGEKYCSGWCSYYLHKAGNIEHFADYFESKELAELALAKFLKPEQPRKENQKCSRIKP